MVFVAAIMPYNFPKTNHIFQIRRRKIENPSTMKSQNWAPKINEIFFDSDITIDDILSILIIIQTSEENFNFRLHFEIKKCLNESLKSA